MSASANVAAAMQIYWATFIELIRLPFGFPELIWGIVPLYFGWFMNEISSSKASYRTAIQNGFSFIWSAANWAYHFSNRPASASEIFKSFLAVKVAVTVLIFIAGCIALVSGLRHRFPPGCKFLGHSRFANYFMIMIFPMQSNYLLWSWNQVITILIFAFPIWLLLHFGLKPLRN